MCLGVPGEILSLEEGPGGMTLGRVSFGGIQKEVCLAYVPEARVGDYVLVHVGFAIGVLDAEQARTVFALLEELDELSGREAGEPE